ncbi:lipoteichoic acid stability factor AuxA [Phocicoccus pinnipedialis]|uniref:Uncharacterized protein n=1 Tax=Phocicoccus pinnipedialis TaxID=110845 RepID=A0A6V7RHC0_9BACL|nr:hypothetical protein [Jeotgalicoccus pinnipedialis]MBP1938980.1 cation transport ATPase [Jeotgalicoccus pinnipedialis]CAD2077312.1 hypothetical protein JEOPIN946_01458 [Jeotgalicoccus pinnipedialis]
MLNRIKLNTEIIASYLLGIFFIIQGLFLVINSGRISSQNESIEVEKIKNIIDLINVFFIELTNILGPILGLHFLIPIVVGLLFIAIGAWMFKAASIMKKTTRYDRRFIIFFFSLTGVMFIWTTVLMFQVYGYTSILFLIAFIIHLLYNIFNEHLDHRFRKEQYLLIMFFYMIAYFFTQNAVYSDIGRGITPTDVLSINMYFSITWILALLSLSVGVFLSKAENILKKPVAEMNDQEYSRVKELRRGRKLNLDFNKYFDFMKYFYRLKTQITEKFFEFFEIKPVSWFRINYIELTLGLVMFLMIFLEFNNRNGVVFEGLFKISNVQYIYEWVNLAITFILASLYMYFTIMNTWNDKYYHRQMIIIVALFVKFSTSLFITIFRAVELSIFILPLNIFLVILTLPLMLISIFKPFTRSENDDLKKTQLYRTDR